MKLKVLLFLFCVFFLSSKSVFAAPNFTLNPTSKSVTTGSTLDVIVGVTTGDVKSSMYDVVLTFDATRLELRDVVLEGQAVADFSMAKAIDNSTGKLTANIYSKGNVYEEKVYNGSLLKLTFFVKSSGTATVNFTCAAGSYSDSNILYVTNGGRDSVDKIVCNDNQTGTYTITGSAASTTTTPKATTPTTAPTSLPATGTVEVTLALIALGVLSVVVGGVAFKL